MEKNVIPLEKIIQQNELLREQNDLLREQNKLLRNTTLNFSKEEQEVFIENIDRDEIRDGFLVTSHRKKLWNIQVGLIQEFARICKKHNISWFAIGGTLIGAARHKGFIPWDFDMDVIMFRPEYEKFQRIAAEELKPHYFLDIWYNYRFESEGASLSDSEGDFQFVTKKQEENYFVPWLTQWPSIRLRDSRTTMLEVSNRNFINQGVWIDIFPLDPLPPFVNKEQMIFFENAKILLLGTAIPARLRKDMQVKKDNFIDYDTLEKFLSKSYRERGKIFEDFMLKNFFISERMGDIRDYCLTNKKKFYHSKDFSEVTYLPFEKISVPAPVGYDSVLTDFYGDWRKFVVTKPHVIKWSADIPYKEYFQEIKIK